MTRFLLLTTMFMTVTHGVCYAQMPIPSQKPSYAHTDMQTVSLYENVKKTTLDKVIRHTLLTNPQLLSVEQRTLLAQEDVDLAKSNYRPSVGAEAGVTYLRADNNIQSGTTSNTSKDVGISLSQPLFRGGRTVAEVNEKRALLDAAMYNFSDASQNVVLDTVSVFVGVIQAKQALDVNKNNRSVLGERLKATNAGFEVGELTRTDVSQSEARYEAAKADVIAAQSAYDNALSAYRRVTGMNDTENMIAPSINRDLIPASLNEALARATNANPSIQSAKAVVKGQGYNVREQQGTYLPEVNLAASAGREYDPYSGGGFFAVDRQDTASVGVRATLPIYQAGVIRNQVRQAKILRSQARYDYDSTVRDVTDNVVTAWNDFQSSEVRIDARRAQVKAARVAYEGIRIEQQVGSRSILDVLDVNQDVRDAELALIGAQSDAVIAYYRLLVAMGVVAESFLDNS